MNRRTYPAPDAPERVQAALAGPSGEVLRLIAAQPKRSWATKHLVDPDQLIPVPGR